MADEKFTREQIKAAWKSPRFNSLREEDRIAIMSEMDPQFAALTALDRRRVVSRFAEQLNAGTPNPSVRPASEDMAAAVGLAEPRFAPPTFGGIAQPPKPPEPGNPMRRPAAPAVSAPAFSVNNLPQVSAAPAAAPRPSSFGFSLDSEPTIPASKPTGVVRNIARPGPHVTLLAPNEEQEFRQWVAKNNVPFDPGPQSDYDMRGYWRALKNRDERVAGSDPLNPPAEFQTPFHPEFSNKSIFAGADAPKWMKDKLVDSFGRVIKDKGAEKEAAKLLAKKNVDSMKKAPAPGLAEITPGMERLGGTPPGVPAPQPTFDPTWQELQSKPGVPEPETFFDPMSQTNEPWRITDPAQAAQFGMNDPGRILPRQALAGAAGLALDAPGGLASMAGNAVGSDALRNAGQALSAASSAITEPMAPPPDLPLASREGFGPAMSDPRWWAASIGNGIGSMVPMMATGAASGAVIEKAITSGVIRGPLAEMLVQYGPAAFAGVQEGILSGGNAYNEAKQSGASEEQAREAFAVVASTTAATSVPAFAAGAMNSRLGAGARTAIGIPAEGLQEVAQGRGEDLAKQIYDSKAPTGSQDLENFVGGAFGGAVSAPAEYRAARAEQEAHSSQPPAAAPAQTLQAPQAAPSAAPTPTPASSLPQQADGAPQAPPPPPKKNPMARKPKPAPAAPTVEEIPADIEEMLAKEEETNAENPETIPVSEQTNPEIVKTKSRIEETPAERVPTPGNETTGAGSGVVGGIRNPTGVEAKPTASEAKNDAVEEAKPPREFSSTQVNLPPDVAERVRQTAAKIPDSDLTEDGREDEVHATVKFGLHTNNADDVRALLADEPPVRVKLGKVSLFENKDADVVKIDVDSPDLHRLNKKIADALPHTDTHPEYKPHVTLAYVKPGQGKKYLGLNDLEGQEVTLNAITFSGKDRQKVDIPLGGKPVTSSEAPEALSPVKQEQPANPANNISEPANNISAESKTESQADEKQELGDFPDPTEIQRLRNAIDEGELILKSGKKTNGEKYSNSALQAIQRSIDNAKIRIAQLESASAEPTTPKKRKNPLATRMTKPQEAQVSAGSSISRDQIQQFKLKKGELDFLRKTVLGENETPAPRGLSNDESAAWISRGWIDSTGKTLTRRGEQAVRAVAQMDAEDVSGRPMAAYKPSGRKVSSPIEGRFSFTKPIQVGDDVWHTNSHFAALGPPPGHWKSTASGNELRAPELGRVLPKKQGSPVKPVGFAPLGKHPRVVVFSDGNAIDADYFDHINRLHNPDKWATRSKDDPYEAYKSGKLVAVVMPVRVGDNALPSNLKQLIETGAGKNNPIRKNSVSAPARMESASGILGRESGAQGDLSLAGTASTPPIDINDLPSTSLPRIPVNRTQIVKKLQERLKGLSIRVGGFSRPRALGIFKVRENVVRVKRPLDLPTIAHEVGHAVHKYLWGTTPNGKDLNSAPLRPFASELGPLDYDQEKQRPFEGFAEYIRLRLTDPVAAANAAPQFDAWLNTVLDTHPDIRDTINDARSEILTWMAQPAAVKLGMSINVTPEKKTVWDRLFAWGSALEYEMVDDKIDLRKAVDLFSRLGAKVPDTANAYKLARMVNGSYARAHQSLTVGVVKADGSTEGTGLKQILEKIVSRPESERNPAFNQLAREWGLSLANDGMDDLRLYLVARRLQDYRENNLETGFSGEELQQAVDATETPDIKAAALAIHDFQDSILQYVVDKRAMTEEIAEQIRAKNQFYVPLYRVMDDEMGRAVQGRKMIDLNSPVMRRKGSQRDIVDPIESISRNTYALISFADRQEVAQALVKQAGRVQDQGALVESGIIRPSRQVKFSLAEITPQIKKALESAGIDPDQIEADDLDVMATIYRPNDDPQRSKNIVKVIVNGDPQLFQMAPDLIRGLDSLNTGSANFTEQFLSPAKNLLAFGATAGNPEFIATNFFRDQWTAGLQSENGYIPFIHGAYGAFKLLTDPKLVSEWERSGGASSAMLPLTRNSLRLSVDKMTMSSKDIVLRHPIEIFTIMKDALTKAGTFAEQSTRIAEYALAKRNGKSQAEAALDSRNVTLDFGRMGHTARIINQMIPFFAVTINAGERFITMHRDEPKKAILRGFLGITLPTLLLWFLNHDDDEYKNVEAWKRDLFWLIPTSPFGLRDLFGPFIRIPKPPLWGQFYGSAIERWADSLINHSPKAFSGFINTLSQLAVPDMNVQTVKPLFEVVANYNLFTDRPIESDQMRKVSPFNRFTPSTSETAKAMSKAFNTMGIELSPVKIEHLMLGYTAGLGRFAVTTLEESLGLRGNRPSLSPSERPILRAFSTPETPYMSTNYMEFRKRLSRLEMKREDARVGQDSSSGAAMRVAGLTEQEAADLILLRKVGKELSGIFKQQSEILTSKALTRDQKRGEIDSLSRIREQVLRDNKWLFYEQAVK